MRFRKSGLVHGPKAFKDLLLVFLMLLSLVNTVQFYSFETNDFQVYTEVSNTGSACELETEQGVECAHDEIVTNFIFFDLPNDLIGKFKWRNHLDIPSGVKTALSPPPKV